MCLNTQLNFCTCKMVNNRCTLLLCSCTCVSIGNSMIHVFVVLFWCWVFLVHACVTLADYTGKPNQTLDLSLARHVRYHFRQGGNPSCQLRPVHTLPAQCHSATFVIVHYILEYTCLCWQYFMLGDLLGKLCNYGSADKLSCPLTLC